MCSQRLPGDTCRFLDTMDIYEDPNAYDLIMHGSTYESKLGISRSLAVKDTSYCEAHDSLCPVRTGASSRTIGWPCKDFSVAGSRMGLSGPNLPIACGAAARAKVADNPLAIIECTDRMPTNLPSDLMGDVFSSWESHILSPDMVGFDCQRRTRFHPL